jgi:hypothetical protein
MFTLRRTAHIASLIGLVATIYVFFHTEFEGEITFAFMLLFLLVAFNTADIESK